MAFHMVNGCMSIESYIKILNSSMVIRGVRAFGRGLRSTLMTAIRAISREEKSSITEVDTEKIHT